MFGLEEVRRRLIDGDETLTTIILSGDRITKTEFSNLMDLLCSNTTVTEFEVYSWSIVQESHDTFSGLAQVLRSNSTLHTLDLDRTCSCIETRMELIQALHHNKSLRKLSLSNNNIGDQGAKALAQALHHNSSLRRLVLEYNTIGDEGANAFAQILHDNSTLKSLNLNFNNILNEGARTLYRSLCKNTTITDIYLKENSIAMNLLEEIESLAEWNKVGELSSDKLFGLTPSCIDYFLEILLILNKVPICDDLHWIIMNMLKVKDIVNSGEPWDNDTWK